MSVQQNSPANVWFEPPATTTVDSPVPAVLVLDSGDWTVSTEVAADGGLEDDGTTDFTIYTTAALPGLNTQLALSSVAGEIAAHEVAP